MSGILRLGSLTKGDTLKQGDKTPLKYRLFDADGEELNIAGKSAKVRLVYPDFLTIGYEKDGLTVSQDDTVTFTIDQAIPFRTYHVEIIVDDKFVFPSRADEAKFTVDKSSLGADANIIKIVGKDVLIQEVKSQVDTELQPLVTSLESAQQAETQRVNSENERVVAETARQTGYNGFDDRLNELETGRAELINISPNTVGGWILYNATASLTNNEYTVTVTNNIDSLRMESRSLTPILGHKYYIAHETKPSVDTEISTHFGQAILNVQGNKDTYTKISAVLEPTNTNPLRIYVRSSVASIGDIHRTRNIMLFDLTDIFGAGNEPTKEEMDELINVTGYIDGTHALNDKEILIWTLALIRRNNY